MDKRKIPAAALATAKEAAARIRDVEGRALAALHERGDTAGHRAGMTEKCLILEALSEEAAERIGDPAGDPDAAAFLAGLEKFAHRAGRALSLESIFYMGALLYPEDYQDGDANDLERFLEGYEAA